MVQVPSRRFDILPPPIETKNQLASTLSKKIYYQAAASNFKELQNFENSSLKNYREAEETSKLLSNRIKEVKHECLQKREELKEALSSSNISPEVKDKLFDLEDDSAFEELKQNLVDTRKNYNCYVEKIEKYSKLAADCRSSSDRVVALYNNPPILDFTAISSLLGKINKEPPPLTLSQIVSGVRKVFKVLCEDFKNLPVLPDANTAEKLKQFTEISKDAEEMEVWLTATISEHNKSLSLLRQKHAVSGGLASMLMSFSTISWPSYNDVASSSAKPTELYTETPDEMLARYKAESVKRLQEEKEKTVFVAPMPHKFENVGEVSIPSCSSGVSERYFSVSQQRQYQIHRDRVDSEYSNLIPTFKARPVPSTTYRKPTPMTGRSQDVFDQSVFEYTKMPSKLTSELNAPSSSTSSDVSDSLFSPPQGSSGNVNSVERTELSGMTLFEWSEPPTDSDQFRNLSLNLESEASALSVDEADSPVMAAIEDLSFGQLEIEEEISRLFGNKRQSSVSTSESSVLQGSLLNIDSLDLDLLT
ncbi:uncharacterized protein LOC136025993 isoform X2 [Artemia franciscana]|uniref:uncharacterized protein LOC136025993 isoform X2 n=1 Tax=Artemia franciscana TaxID=6661 RepID=UPI0032DA4608